MQKPICNCAYNQKLNHSLGEDGCSRMIAIGSLIPTNFRQIDYFGDGILMDVCDVNNYTITVYTLLYQRLYRKHDDGQWSLPKNKESFNSLEGEW